MKINLLIILFLICVKGFAAENKVKHDTSDIEIRSPEAKKIKDFQSSKDFHYNDIPKSGNSILEYITYYIQKIFNLLFSNQGIMPFIRYLLIALFIAFVVYQLAKNQINTIFTGKSQRAGEVYDVLEEDLDIIDFDQLIGKELSNKNFRLVVRLYYLKMLKALDKKGLIKWQPNKTNREYYYDLSGTGIEQKYKQLTWIYENIWYGDFQIKDDYFNHADVQFKQIFKEIASDDK